MKRTRIVMSELARDKLRKASSGFLGQDFSELPPAEKNEYASGLDIVIEELMLTEPDSFTRRAIAHASEKRARQMARK